MSHKIIGMLSVFFLNYCCLYSQGPDAFETWWEKSGYTETPRYEPTVEFCKRLSEASPFIACEVFGKSSQGRDMYLLILDKNGFTTPEEVDKGRKIKVLVQACIHPGESEGKDAGLTLFRDIALRNKDLDLDSITVLFIPIFNTDGHERFTPYSRINQNGPVQAGWRTTATNLNLNRDYLKADTPEMQAWLQLFSRWNPDFFIDCHTSDGADYQYPVTIEYDGFTDKSLTQWLSSSYIPWLKANMERSGYPVFNYVSFRRWHDPRSGLENHVLGPRFSTGYVAARNRFALLIETHMLKDYKTRVLGTYHILEHSLAFLAKEKASVQALLKAADQYTATYSFRSDSLVLDSKPSMTDSIMVTFRGIDYTVEKSALTGGNWYRYNSKPVDFVLPMYNKQVPTLKVGLPVAYIIPVEWQEVIKRLEWHGISYDVLKHASQIPVETYRFSQPVWASEPYEGRQIITSLKTDTVKMKIQFAAGSVVISTRQPNVRLLAFMFEPRTSDSFLRWGYFNSVFEEKEFVETYVMEEMARMMIRKDPGLKVRFDQLKTEDPEFAADPYAQLKWFYRRTPYYDKTVGLYPVGRIMSEEVLNSLNTTADQHR